MFAGGHILGGVGDAMVLGLEGHVIGAQVCCELVFASSGWLHHDMIFHLGYARRGPSGPLSRLALIPRAHVAAQHDLPAVGLDLDLPRVEHGAALEGARDLGCNIGRLHLRRDL